MTFIFDGPQDGPLFIFAHGAGAGAESEFMQTVALGLADKGIRVARFNFPYMQKRMIDGKRRPPERADKLVEYFKTLVDELDQPVVIGGKSMGGRIASMLAAENPSQLKNKIKGVAGLGFPFHPTGKPQTLRTGHFKDISVPVLIIQGERDTMGSKEEVSGYQLPDSIDWLWLTDGNHDLKPRVKSGFSHQQHLNATIEKLAEFVTLTAGN